ncbi:BTB/POZ domain-containing protein [Ditylenchus destructor]|nr:BTB/POZ domain-containing protein [Ditylenchus destructor]
MSGSNSAPKDEWVRLNVGGKVFQTTKDTLSRYPDTFLARLVNGGLSSDKDESGAYLIDADPEHFRTILNYLRRGTVTLDASKVILGDLLREADFFNIEPLVIEIRQAMSAPDPMKEMTNQILTKMEDMSKKLSNVGSGPMFSQLQQGQLYRHPHGCQCPGHGVNFPNQQQMPHPQQMHQFQNFYQQSMPGALQ